MRTVGVRLMADVAGYTRNLGQAGKATREFRGELEKASTAGRLDQVTDTATRLGVGLLGAAGAAVKMAADFDRQMSSVRAATHATAGDMDRLRQAALDAGADTKFSATEAGKGIEELSKAGITTADILSGGLSGALSLAAAGELDVGEAAETAASAMTQFKLKGKDVPRIADLLAAGAGKAQGSVQDMGAALNQSGLVAAQMGLSIEETTGTLASFASAGLMGSDAGTSLKTAMLMLANPTEKSSDLMAELGINAYDASGKFVGMQELAGQLKTRLSGLTQEQRNSALATIFGSDAIRAASVLYEQGEKGIADWTAKVNDSGYAAETAQIKTDNLSGDVERLTGSLQTLAIESGGGANSGLRVLTQGANGLVDQFALLPSGISGTITVLALLGGALTLGSVGWLKMRRSNAEALEELRATGPAGTRAAGALETTSKWAGRAAVAFAAAQLAAAGMSAAFGQNLNAQVDALASSLADWERNGKKAGEASRLLGDDFEHLSYDLGTMDGGFWAGLGNGVAGFVESMTGLGDVFDESLVHAKERLTGIDSALTQLVQSGQGDQAARVFDKLAAEAKKSGVSVTELRKGLPQYAAALQTAGAQSQKTAADITAVGESADDAEKQAEELKDAFDALFGSQMSLDRATIKYQQGIGELSKELRKGDRSLSSNTEEGRKNRTAVLDQLDSINDLRIARVKHGWSMDDASEKYKKDIDGLKKSMRQAGFTEKQVDDLTDAYRDIPRGVTSSVQAKGVPGVRKQLADLVVLQQALKKGVSMGNARALAGDAAAARDRGLFDAGGWTGPGGKLDVAGLVHADEFVVQKSARAPLEEERPGALDYMNRTGRWPGYDGGGLVRWPFPATAAITRVPSRKEAESAVSVPFPSGGGPTSDAIVAAARMLVPHVTVLSKDRPGARTLSGNTSYHARRRAVDFEPSFNLARLWNERYKSRTKELISPYQQYNLHNGQRHTYTGAIWNQHNFAGGNPHDHIAMKNGGQIREPIYGVGASGRTYSFGENWQAETTNVVPSLVSRGLTQAGSGGSSGTSVVINLNANLSAGANVREAGRQIAEQLQYYLSAGGEIRVNGKQLVGAA